MSSVKKFSEYAVGIVGILTLLGLGCSADGSSGCEEATEEMQRLILGVCNELAFSGTGFCGQCVPNGYFSVDNTGEDCSCGRLVFDADFCAYERSSNARPKVRAAVEALVKECRDPSLPRVSGQPDAQDVNVAQQDGGAE